MSSTTLTSGKPTVFRGVDFDGLAGLRFAASMRRMLAADEGTESDQPHRAPALTSFVTLNPACGPGRTCFLAPCRNRANLFGGRLGNSRHCRYVGMERRLHPPAAAYELLLIDADLEHLHRAVALEVAAPRPVLPLTYWRRRVAQIVETRHLLPAQLAVACALMDLLESTSTSRLRH